MNQVIKRISLIVADPCDGYTCLCARCQQNLRDLEKAYNDSFRESWVASQPTQELPTLQLPDAPARIHTHRW